MEEIKYLKQFTPAEALLVVMGKKAPLRDLLKFTFLHLLFKNVLKTIEVTRQPGPRDDERSYKYVARGENFDRYPQSRKHEQVFLSHFEEQPPEARILFRNIVKLGYEEAGAGRKYQNLIAQSPDLAMYVERNWLQRVFGGFEFTSGRKVLAAGISREVDYLRKRFPQELKSGKSKAYDLLKSIGANFFLFSIVDSKLLGMIDKELVAIMHQHPTESYAGGGCVGGCSSWDGYDSNSGDFDSSCSAHSSGSGCSGCSGDSGCSGCSGCGGGCGGGD